MDNVQYVSLGWEHSAAITEDGRVYMWGKNNYGQVGNGKSGESEIQTEPVKIMDNVQYVSLGLQTSAVITKDGSLYMWGNNAFNNIIGFKDNVYVPTRVYIPGK